MCLCKNGEQTIDRILFDCELVEKEGVKLKVSLLRLENWPVNKEVLINKYGKDFKEFADSISFTNVYWKNE